MDQHNVHAGAHLRQGVPYRILPLLTARDNLEYFRETVGRHNVIKAVFALALWNSKNNFMNRGRGL
jgi:hypothetical protein